MRQRRPRLDLGRAEEIGIEGLSFLAGDSDRLARFLGLTGFGPADLQGALRDPTVLAAVLEYLLGDEPLLLECAANRSVEPEQIQLAWDLLTLDGMKRSRT